jgi:putative oxidoreductase
MTDISDRPAATHHDTRPLVDRVAADWGNLLWLVARILIALIFVQSGWGKLMDLDGFAAMLSRGGVPLASVLAPLGALVELGGGIAIVLGLGTRYAAALLIAFTIVATLIAHRFWDYPPDQQQMQMVQFAKNIAIIGGFLFVFVTGGGQFSLDHWLRRRG